MFFIGCVKQKGDFPQTRKIIRKAAIRLALTREFCRIADQVRLARMLGRRLSTINLPNQVMDASSHTPGELTPRGTTQAIEPSGRRRSVLADQSSVNNLGNRLGKMEDRMSAITRQMQEGFEKLQRLSAGGSGGPRRASAGAGGAGAGAGSSGQAAANLNELWDALEGDKSAVGGNASQRL